MHSERASVNRGGGYVLSGRKWHRGCDGRGPELVGRAQHNQRLRRLHHRCKRAPLHNRLDRLDLEHPSLPNHNANAKPQPPRQTRTATHEWVWNSQKVSRTLTKAAVRSRVFVSPAASSTFCRVIPAHMQPNTPESEAVTFRSAVSLIVALNTRLVFRNTTFTGTSHIGVAVKS